MMLQGPTDVALTHWITEHIYKRLLESGVKLYEWQGTILHAKYFVMDDYLAMAYSGRFVAENERGEGLCKIIASGSDGTVLGVHMIGNPCSEIIPVACVAIERSLKAAELGKVIFPHPTVPQSRPSTRIMMW